MTDRSWSGSVASRFDMPMTSRCSCILGTREQAEQEKGSCEIPAGTMKLELSIEKTRDL